jgi:hypothetical protein
MAEAVPYGNIQKVHFNGFLSAIMGGAMILQPLGLLLQDPSLVVSMVFMVLLLWIVNAIYVGIKVNAMKKKMMEIAPYYYETYSTQGLPTIFAWGSFSFLLVVGLVFAVFAPIIFAYKTIEIFNDMARQHNANLNVN